MRGDFIATEKQKACLVSKAGFLNMAPLNGVALAINWLIGKLNLKTGVVKTTRMTTFSESHFLHVAVLISCSEW